MTEWATAQGTTVSDVVTEVGPGMDGSGPSSLACSQTLPQLRSSSSTETAWPASVSST